MIGISRHTDYAARIVLHLALRKGDGLVTAGEIAKRRLIPPAFVRRIVSRLSAAGILKTTRGCGGGMALARPASRISLLDVVVAMEGKVSLNACTAEPEDCPISPSCAVRKAWVKATNNLEALLKGVNFSSLAKKGGEAARQHPVGAKVPKARSRSSRKEA